MKRGILILLLAICVLFTISSVCASDVNDTAVASEDEAAIEVAQSEEIDDASETDLASDAGDSSLEASGHVEISINDDFYSSMKDHYVFIEAPSDATGNVTVTVDDTLLFNKDITKCKKDYNDDSVIGYRIQPEDLNVTLDLNNHYFVVKYLGDDNYSPVTRTKNVPAVPYEGYSSDAVSIIVYDEDVDLNPSGDWEDCLVRIDSPSSATGKIAVLINGEKVCEKDVSTMYIRLSDLSKKLDYLTTYDIEVRYSGDGTYSPVTKSGRIKTVYPFGAIMEPGTNVRYGQDYFLRIYLPEDASGDLTVTVDGNTYPVTYANGFAKVNMSEISFGIGKKYNLTVELKNDAKYPYDSCLIGFSYLPSYIYPSFIAYGEEPVVIMLAPGGTNLDVKVAGNGIEVNAKIVDGRGIFQMPKLASNIIYFSVAFEVDGDRVSELIGFKGVNRAQGYESSVDNSEIFAGENVTVTLTGPKIISDASIYVDGVEIKVNSTTDVLTKEISGLQVGQHALRVWVTPGDGTLYACSYLITVRDMVDFDIKKTVDINSPEAQLATVMDGNHLDGNVTVTIDGKVRMNRQFTAADGMDSYVILVKDLDLDSIGYGDKPINITYKKNNANEYSKEGIINITAIPNVFFPNSMLVGESAALVISGPKGFSGEIAVYWAEMYWYSYTKGDLYATSTITDGFGTVTFSNLDKGYHKFIVDYIFGNYVNILPDGMMTYDYYGLNVVDSLEGLNSSVSPSTIKENESLNLTVHGDGSYHQMDVFIDGKEYNSTTLAINETFIKTISGLSVGTHYISVVIWHISTSPDYSYTHVVHVKDKYGRDDPGLSISPIGDVELGSDVSVTITADANFNGVVAVQVANNNGTATLTNGKGSFTIPADWLSVGKATIRVTSKENDKFIAGSAEATFNVIPKVVPPEPTPVDQSKIVANDLTAYYNKVSYSVTVYGADGKLASGVLVTFKINGKNVATAKTNAKGVATVKLSQVPKTYKITSEALGKSVTKKLTVKQVLTLKKVKVKKSAKKLVLTATLKEGKKAIKGKKITFKFKGKKVKTVRTNKKGIAKVTVKKSVLKKLKKGKKVTYQATYLKDVVKRTVKVKK